MHTHTRGGREPRACGAVQLVRRPRVIMGSHSIYTLGKTRRFRNVRFGSRAFTTREIYPGIGHEAWYLQNGLLSRAAGGGHLSRHAQGSADAGRRLETRCHVQRQARAARLCRRDPAALVLTPGAYESKSRGARGAGESSSWRPWRVRAFASDVTMSHDVNCPCISISAHLFRRRQVGEPAAARLRRARVY